jgi:hypothetical protein
MLAGVVIGVLPFNEHVHAISVVLHLSDLLLFFLLLPIL